MKNNKDKNFKGDKRENKAAPKDSAEGSLKESGLDPNKPLRESHMDVQKEGDSYEQDLRQRMQGEGAGNNTARSGHRFENNINETGDNAGNGARLSRGDEDEDENESK